MKEYAVIGTIGMVFGIIFTCACVLGACSSVGTIEQEFTIPDMELCRWFAWYEHGADYYGDVTIDLDLSTNDKYICFRTYVDGELTWVDIINREATTIIYREHRGWYPNHSFFFSRSLHTPLWV